MPNRLGAFKDSKYGVIGVVDLPLQFGLILNYDWLRLTQCPGSCTKTTYLSPVEIRALMINEAVSAGLIIAKEVLGRCQ
jgi:hypothetical protein